MATHTRAYVTAAAAGQAEHATVIYRRVAAVGQASDFVFLLWATAVTVARCVEVAAAIGRPCPTCRTGVLHHLELGVCAVYSCGHLEEVNDVADTAVFDASRRAMFIQVSAILGSGGRR